MSARAVLHIYFDRKRKNEMLQYLTIFGISMVPLIELRGAIPAGYALGMPMILNFLICCIGNLLPIPVILIFVKFVLDWMRRSNVAFFNKVSGFIYEKAEKNKPKITKYATWGLFIFVAIPLPGTGAWTGALVAALLDMKRSKAMLSIAGGVLAAGAVVTLICYGAIDFLRFLI